MEDESNNSNYTIPPEYLERDSIAEQLFSDDGIRPGHLLRRPSGMFEGSVVSGNNSFIRISDGTLAAMLQGALDVDEMLLSDSDDDDSDSGGSQSRHNLLLETFQRRAVMENSFKLHSSDHSNFSIGRKELMMRGKEKTIIEEESPSSRIIASKPTIITETVAMDRSSSIPSGGIEFKTTAFVKKSATMMKPAAFKLAAFIPHKVTRKQNNNLTTTEDRNYSPKQKEEKNSPPTVLIQNKKNLVFHCCCLILALLIISLIGIFILLLYKKNIILHSEKATVVSTQSSSMAMKTLRSNSLPNKI